MNLYKRGEQWWVKVTFRGHQYRMSTRCDGEDAARLVGLSYERAIVIRELIREDVKLKPLLARLIREAGDTLVYFVLAERSRLIKIGFARDLPGRLAVMRNGSAEPLRLLRSTKGTRADERALHGRFADLRVHGEWFRADEPLLSFASKSPDP